MIAQRARSIKVDEIKDWLKPTLALEGRICTLLLQSLSELEIGQLYGTGFKSEEQLKASKKRAEDCFEIMDELRGDGVYSCREKSYNSVLRETMIESEEKNSDWSLHSQGFKYLASYILNY